MKETVPARLFARASTTPDAPAYATRGDGDWHEQSWRGYADEVRRAGNALIALGVDVGGRVAILGFNRPEWSIFHVAAMSIGASGAGIYTTSSPDEVEYIVRHSEASVVLVENGGQLAKLAAARDRLPAVREIVLMGDTGAEGALSWPAFLARADDAEPEEFDRRMEALERDQLATLIYTSGTTGPPKAVMLSHHNLAWTADAFQQVVDGREGDSVLSYLPLAHIAEQMFTIHGAISYGMKVYYAESLERLAANLKETQPSLFFGVPRVWEKFYAGLSERLAGVSGVPRLLVVAARTTAAAVNAARREGREPGLFLRWRFDLLDRLLLGKLKRAIGLGNARICATGAAPIAAEILEFFASLDVNIVEVYGQSEDCGPTSCNRPGATRFGTVGPAVPGVEIRLADDGEILVRGDNVFLGYLKDEAATKEVLEDGWLKSGDLGEMDDDGFLRITGRKKEIIITSGGKNITPKNIEEALKQHRLVTDAIVIGDQRKYLTALLTVDPDAVEQFLIDSGDVEKHPPHQHPVVRRSLEEAVEQYNAGVTPVAQVKKFAVLPRQLSIEEGELTPTMKVKRRVVNEKFRETIESLYRD